MSKSLELVTDENLERVARRFDGGSGGGNNGSMEARIESLEAFALSARERLTRIETKLDAAATREDLHRELGAQTWRIIGAVITLGTLLSGVVYFIARNVR